MNENKVHSILKSSPVGFAYHEIIIDHENNLRDYRFIDINPAFEKITGLKKESIIGNTVRNSFQISGSIGVVWLNIYEIIKKGDESLEFEYYIPDIAKWFMISAYLTDSTHFAITLTDITLSKQSPTVKQTKKAQQLPFWDNNLFGLLIADKNGNYVEANEEVCRMTGYSCQELKNMNLFNLIDPEKTDEARNHFEHITKNGRAYGEIAYYTKEGEKRWWNVVATQLSDDFFLGLHEDITARKKMEQELSLNVELNKKLLATIPDVVIQTNLEGIITYVNEQGIINYPFITVENLIGRNFLSFVAPEDQRRIKENLKLMFEKPLGIKEYTLCFGDGLDIYCEANGEVIRDSKGNPISMVFVIRDITERKRAKEALYRSEERLNLAMAVKNEGIWDWNLFTKETYFDERYYTMAGYSPNEFPNSFEGWKEKLHPDDLFAAESAIKAYLAGEMDNYDIEFRFKCKDGSWMWIHGRGKVVERNEAGAPLRIIGTHTDITERKRAEDALQNERDQLLSVFNSIDQAVYIADTETYELLYANQFLADLLDGDLIGDKCYKTLQGLDAPCSFCTNNIILKQKFKPYRWEFYNNKLDRYYDIIDRIIHWPDGRDVRFEIAIDITERKRAEEALKESEERFKSLHNASFGGIAIHDKGIILECNLGLSEMTGYSVSELIGMDGLMLISEKSREEVASKIKSGYEKPYEAIGLRKNGDEYPMRLEARNVQYKGKPVRTVEFRDITQIKRAEEELIKAKEKAEENNKVNIARLKLIQFSENHTVDEILEETLNEAEQVLDSKIGFFHFINEDQATLTLQNWSTNTKVSLCKAKGKGEHYPIEKAGVWVDCALTQKPVIHNNFEELPHKKGMPEGHAAIIRELTVPIIYDNKLKAIIGLGNKETDYNQSDVENLTLIAYLAWEIIEKKKAFEALQIAKEKAEESDRLKSAFLANMSHEIRTPMNGILGFADLLKEPELSGEDQRKYIDIIEKSGRRMLNIINDIIDISKIEAGLMELRMTESDIKEQIDYIYVFFKPEAEAKGLKISVNNSLGCNDEILITDREKLYAILTNLVKNAIKYTEKGEIEIGCVRKNDYIEFYVKDTGIGIPKNRQEAVFERFIQADIEDKMALQGAGLGLAITKAYIEMMGGSIWLESEVGKGSIFFFNLPIITKSNKKNDIKFEEFPNYTSPQISQLNVLIVEDDEVSEMLLEKELRKSVKGIIKARNGLDAVETVKRNMDIDLIMMDLRLPRMDGYEATRQIRLFNKDVIIIAQTAYGLSGDRERAIEAGCNDYIAKPIESGELYSLLHKFFDK